MSSEKSATRRKQSETGSSSFKGSTDNLNAISKQKFSFGSFRGESNKTPASTTTTITTTSSGGLNLTKKSDGAPKTVAACPDDSPNYIVYKKVKITFSPSNKKEHKIKYFPAIFSRKKKIGKQSLSIFDGGKKEKN